MRGMAMVMATAGAVLTLSGGGAELKLLRSNRPGMVYQCNEVAEIVLAATPGLEVTLRESNDGGKLLRERKARPENGEIVCRFTMDKPSFRRLEATAGKLKCVVAAGFEPEKIRPYPNEPADFDIFWQNTLSAARRTGKVTSEKLPSCSGATYTTYLLTASLLNGRKVYGFLTLPESSVPTPLIVTVAGAGPGFGPDLSFAAAKTAVLVLNVFPYPAPLEAAAREKAYAAWNVDPGYRFAGAPERDEYFFRSVFAGFVLLTDYAAELRTTDAERIGFYGSSQGGASVIALAALSGRAAAVTANVPGMCDQQGDRNGYLPGWPRLMERCDDAATRRMSGYFDAVNFGRRLKCPLHVLVGFVDGVCSPSSIYAMYNTSSAVPKRISPVPDMAHECRAIYLEQARKELLTLLGGK